MKTIFLIILFEIQLFSPGELSKYHEHLEGDKNCYQCHSNKGEQIDQNSCLKCHTGIKKSIDSRKYHFHTTKIEKKSCENCHKEHFKNRYPLYTIEKDFNHDVTGYKLEGKHKKLECRECHKESFIVDKSVLADKNIDKQRTYLGLGVGCVGCHPNSFHKDEISDDDCSACHDQTSFKNIYKTFEHDNTEFPLNGAHKKVRCDKCHEQHPKVDYLGESRTPLKHKVENFENCISCHKKDDIHNGVFGESCERCHTEKSFKDSIFDKKTHSDNRFPLIKKHGEVDCKSCHTEKLNKIPEDKRCISCHKKDDIHNAQYGESCEQCHTIDGFKFVNLKQFNHDKTGFQLKGIHKKADCLKCHQKNFKYNKDKNCLNCHQDIHNGEYSAKSCENCHNQQFFSPSEFTQQEHQKTNFKLSGAHNAVSCKSCHKVRNKTENHAVLMFKNSNTRCADCHQSPHCNEFSERIEKAGCESCHITESFKVVKFDHDKDTAFPLKGKHKNANCYQCHQKMSKSDSTDGKICTNFYKERDADCSHCHTDVHLGELSDKKCSDCHDESSFKSLTKFDHNRDSNFKLDGKHLDVSCSKCHPAIEINDKYFVKYRTGLKKCIDCHDPYHFKK